MIDVTVEGESLNVSASKGYGLYSAEAEPGLDYVGGFETGSYICYDEIDLAGVQSIDIAYARDASVVSPVGRFAVLWNGSDVEIATNLGEKLTSTTNAWETFATINVGLAEPVNEVGQLCFRGLQGNGIMNVDSFTLRAAPGENDGVTNFDLTPPQGPEVPAITTYENQVLIGGEARSLAGNSFFWSNGPFGSDIWYTEEVVDWLVEDWGTQIVRAAVAVDDTKPQNATPIEELGGYITVPFENKLNATKIINAAIENGIYVIIDWHAHKAEDHTEEAIEFFQDMAATYGSYNNVIYEIYNEPVDTQWPAIKSYAEQVIAAIRAVDPDNLIIVGTSYYSQKVVDAARDPITAYDNIAYTLHFYAGTHTQSLRNDAAQALELGIPLFVTEWGTTDASGDGNIAEAETRAWMQFLKENNISHLNWAVSGHGQASAILTREASVEGNWDDADLTPSGRLVKDIIANW